jgi:hypothetical protein
VGIVLRSLTRSFFAVAALAVAATAALVGACNGSAATPAADAGVPGDEGAPLTCGPVTVADPDIGGTAAWTPVRGAVLASGAATLDAVGICDHGGIAQTLPSSPLACARPLVLSFDVSVQDLISMSFAVGVGGGWNLPIVAAGVPTVNVCLGARLFGTTLDRDLGVDLFLGPGNNVGGICPPPGLVLPPPVGDPGPSLALTRVAIGADVLGACPLPGTVPNGDFALGAEGWTIKPGDGVAEIAPLGEGASSAIHLATAHFCEHPSLSETISLPTSAMVPHPALRVWSRGSGNAAASIRIGTLVPTYYTGATYLDGRDDAVSANICLPRWAQGTVQPLEIRLVSTQFTEECVSPGVRDFVLDSLAFVSEPACPTDADAFDPSFENVVEAPGVAPFWALEQYDDRPDSKVALVTDGSAAHTGKVGARFTASSPCPHASISGAVTVPAPAGAAGPALKLSWRTGASQHDSLFVVMNAFSTAPKSLPLAPAWTQATICLDPDLAGRPELLRIGVMNVDGGGTCANGFPEETIDLDDVTLGTDPSCPAM